MSQQQRTIYSNQQRENSSSPGMAAGGIFGTQREVEAASKRTVEETVRELVRELKDIGHQGKNNRPPGLATVAAFGMQHRVPAGRTAEETLLELNLFPQPHQSVRVNGREIHDLAAYTLHENDIVTVTNVVRGGDPIAS